MSEIKFGIIGSGRMAATMAVAFGKLSGAKVVAVASESAGRAEACSKHFAIPKAYNQIKDLLADSEIDAVYIANATESHAQTTIQALTAGKAVLCEKPIAISAAESEQIEAAAARSGKLCMEAMWTLFLPAYKRLFEMSEARAVGAPLHLYTDFGYPVSQQAYPRLFSPVPGSGVLLDRGVYPIALALKLFGSAKKVSGNLNVTANGVDTEAFLAISHDNGCYSQLAVSINALLQNRAVLSCVGGSISLEPPVIGAEAVAVRRILPDDKVSSFDAAGTLVSFKQRLRQLPVLRRINSLKNGLSNEYHSWGANQYLPVLNHFCELFRAQKLESEIMPLRLSTQVLQVIDQAKQL
ncbi:MAG: Gfo/Idh/MocA family oxidoreductase [Methyloglobulus sp.]|nr:Gfo/Idh/MocA family oxidoreductase [Methyloglobulus sp.]